MQHAPDQPAQEAALAVIGTDASGLSGLPAPSLVLVRVARLLLAPQRLLADVAPWWPQEQAAGRILPEDPCPALLASDRVALLAQGRICFEGTPDEFSASGNPVVGGFRDSAEALGTSLAAIRRGDAILSDDA